ncbi:hypothetical protein GE09DRAFT_1224712 [Coniochaeta sp. 2T2.1]|nr:hypothetical protein GE09DRAFT_1224712 [Coniochaeta sp. 2T2.1]
MHLLPLATTLLLLPSLTNRATADLRYGYQSLCSPGGSGWARARKLSNGTTTTEFTSTCASPGAELSSYTSDVRTGIDLDKCLRKRRNVDMSKYLDCECQTGKQTGPETKSSSVDLSEELYIDEAEIFGCFDNTGWKLSHP